MSRSGASYICRSLDSSASKTELISKLPAPGVSVSSETMGGAPTVISTGSSSGLLRMPEPGMDGLIGTVHHRGGKPDLLPELPEHVSGADRRDATKRHHEEYRGVWTDWAGVSDGPLPRPATRDPCRPALHARRDREGEAGERRIAERPEGEK